MSELEKEWERAGVRFGGEWVEEGQAKRGSPPLPLLPVCCPVAAPSAETRGARSRALLLSVQLREAEGIAL